jgi:hypothetical protein
MARDLLCRPALQVSALPPNKISMHPGEPRTIVCPGCDRWVRPSNGGLRRHTVAADSTQVCPESGRRVWFDIEPARWITDLRLGIADAATRRSASVQRKAMPPVPPPVCRMAAAR